MLNFIAAVIFLSLFLGLILWLNSLTSTPRQRAIAQAAEALNADFDRWAPAPADFLAFYTLQSAQLRYLHNALQNPSVHLFDFTTISDRGATTQTAIILPCQRQQDGMLLASRHPWLSTDAMTLVADQTPSQMSSDDLPPGLRNWTVLATPAHRIRQWLSTEVTDWLLAHPHLHIEWAGGMLLVCQPGYLIDPAEITLVIRDVSRLRDCLSQP